MIKKITRTLPTRKKIEFILYNNLPKKDRDNIYRMEKKENRSNYFKELRQVAISLGRCSHCLKERDNIKFKWCSRCRDAQRLSQRLYCRRRKK